MSVATADRSSLSPSEEEATVPLVIDTHVLQAHVLAHRRFPVAAAAFTSELALALGAARVSLGFARRHSSQVLATSGGGVGPFIGAQFDTVAEAMDEALQQRASVHVSQCEASRSQVSLAHARLLSVHGGAVLTVPVVQWGRAVGAVTCEWAAPARDPAALVEELEATVNLVGPLLDLMRRREKSAWLRLQDLLREGHRRLQASRRLQWLAGGTVAVASLLTLMPVDVEVGGVARVQGEQQRSLAAPANGFLKAVHARPGDQVRTGQVLVELADEDLLLQQQKWRSELGRQEHGFASAMAADDRPAMVIALARAEQARAEMALVDTELERGSIVAPFDGVVLEGDLSQSIGAPVERGAALLVLAPGQQQRVIVEVDERDIARVRPTQSGRLALSALPWDSIALEVTRVTPIARNAEGRNIFEVEARMEAADSQRVRPGLQGVAKFDVGQAPLAWAWTHALVDRTRLALWRWLA